MPSRIGLISDVHASPEALGDAFAVFDREGVDAIICAGDIAGYHDQLEATVDLLYRSGCSAIVGNHDLEYLDSPPQNERAARDYLQSLPRTLDLEIEGRSLLVVHASPPAEVSGSGIRLLDPAGEIRADRRREWSARLDGLEHDLLIVGHTHQVFSARLGEVLVVNPGSTVFNHSCSILSLPEMSVQHYPLGGREIIRCWNFALQRR